ncbi:uncharacterized protein CC84DRAFT_112811 [Paraphaeosphaeria sporulosa]|uniref:Uncharacterized protein n=1 Tax=Paraphaeosphaeria sporulosa TaxID=1460663 RepID=A0A177CZK3_9PLEO|nr:uncharacterized protein CC84DRAFT_112811 [Paraphaeosphaeria sporulosa]OAG12332.1 hypothetical protein CC84DRAFT_112811 [Paraphaeosphaeria sporulosa]
MKYTSAVTIAVATLLHSVNANFDLYRVGLGGTGVSGNGEGWQAYEAEANCDNKLDWYWVDSEDVSGGKYGVRCEGDGCGRSQDDDDKSLDVIEMNFNRDEHHWTYYKDRDGALVDLSDNQVGRCYPFPGPNLNCGLTVGRVDGYRKIRCEIDVTADDINGGRPSKRRAARDFTA